VERTLLRHESTKQQPNFFLLKNATAGIDLRPYKREIGDALETLLSSSVEPWQFSLKRENRKIDIQIQAKREFEATLTS
jgi:hypothetical protein